MTLSPEQFAKISTKEDLAELEEKMDHKMDQKIDKVLNAVDGLAKKFDNFHAEMAANQAAHDRFEESIAELKKRVGQLERK